MVMHYFNFKSPPASAPATCSEPKSAPGNGSKADMMSLKELPTDTVRHVIEACLKASKAWELDDGAVLALRTLAALKCVSCQFRELASEASAKGPALKLSPCPSAPVARACLAASLRFAAGACHHSNTASPRAGPLASRCQHPGAALPSLPTNGPCFQLTPARPIWARTLAAASRPCWPRASYPLSA
jgi:hypothetical protein